MNRIAAVLFIFVASFSALAQEQAVTSQSATSPMSTIDLFNSQLIPRNSRIYISPMKSEDASKPVEGFETYLAAALRKKKVPLLIVTDRTQADFEIVGTADKKGAGWAKKVFLGDWRSTTSASMSIINLKTSVVAYSDASHRSSANKGMRSSAEKLAKYLKRKIEDDEKKLKQL